MGIGLSEEHKALHESVRRWAGDRCPPSVARKHLDAAPGTRPPIWEDVAAQGWLGLHLPEDAGGSGYGLLETAIVLEELGRTVAPGPVLPTVAVSAVLRHAGVDAEVLAGLASGERTAALADGVQTVTATSGDGGVVLDGEVRPVLGAADADLFLVGARDGDEDEVWALVPAADCEVVPLESLDGTRSLGAVALENVRVEESGVVDGLGRRLVRDLAGILAAAEAVGVAGWCLDATTGYATTRHQFGRPIGQFQAVKHRLAEMLVGVEQAGALVWDAARTADEAASSASDEQDELAAPMARALALEVAVDAAKDAVQLHGGIGFTWEHDVHLYLKRALALRGLHGPLGDARRRVAELALEGHRRQLVVELPDGVDETKREVTALLDETADLDRPDRRARLADAGYLAPHYPEPWGLDADAVTQLAIEQAFDEAGIRRPTLSIAGWVLPTLIAHGTDEQQKRWIPPSLRGELAWCQLFSEPEAGSDLASLTTRAVRDDGGWRLTGQKVWTSLAAAADLAICLARTDPDAPKHDGITYFVLDMDAEGVEVRPLREMTGDEMFNEVFLSDVFVPDDQVVGEVNGGWQVTRDTLAAERVAMSRGSAFGGGLEGLLATLEGHPARTDPVLLDRLGALLCEGQSVSLLGFRATLRAIAGEGAGGDAAVRKLLGVEHAQRVSELAVELLGAEAAVAEDEAAMATKAFLFNRCLTIAGGTSEVQRNVIGERLLGLPRLEEPTS